MTKPRLVVVSGSGRCGSSMLMQMLDAGGLNVSGVWPDFEDPRAMRDFDPEWLNTFEGVAKVLDPHRYVPADLRLEDTKAIWLDRDRKQQARSWCKVGDDLKNGQSTKEDVKRVAHLLKKARRPGVDHLVGMTGRGPLSITYESILARPLHYSKVIESFLETELDTKAMAGQVIPRPSACMTGLLERDMVRMGRPEVERMIHEMRDGAGG